MKDQGLAAIRPFSLPGCDITLGADSVRFSGVLTVRSPTETVTPFLRKVHGAAMELELKTVTADLTLLRFMNSSAIRCLVDWVDWIANEPEPQRYVLRFLTMGGDTWQTPTLAALKSLGGDWVKIVVAS